MIRQEAVSTHNLHDEKNKEVGRGKSEATDKDAREAGNNAHQEGEPTSRS